MNENSQELRMYITSSGRDINIVVLPHYAYGVHGIREMGKVTDSPGIYTAWAWVNHLREKNWWNTKNEKKFLKLAKKLTK